MIYNEDKSSGMAFPLIVILFVMATMVGALVLTTDNTTSTRVWIPSSAAGP
ncbi:hypothetical protein [Rhizobium mesoamericanum]|uniref:hypothetical protein n=1 Tax=Rhizobium mesoamericanum TaxID=1079800 RepID=UPI00040C5EBE|nr:hypothetical protein [Rhizobium mesoamericanum]